MENSNFEKLALEEINRIVDLLRNFGVKEKRINVLYPIIENTAYMKIKLDETRETVSESSVVVSYDNGGGQSGIRENPVFKGYESLWKSYMSGMSVILGTLPQEIAKEETEKVVEVKTMLELVRDKHRKEA